ncbi:ABC transporter family protein [Tritrichomonas foetus]|uniref:ABC transporter family protein n=1 Tax=Tritrichomonas foetus TaxID=1144522 RepID=A0A1J4K262_9EUKA|nr:ABC transporter family protein [Tritrichomonas foetus]|eukprot:OHT03822.1 ABC transporter family protein [Tritrichomonas foetus]
MGLKTICPPNHFKAILYKRLIIVKRSLKSILTSIIGTLIFSSLGIAVQWLMIELMKPKYKPILYNIYKQDRNDFVIVGNENDIKIQTITKKMSEMFQEETKRTPTFTYFDNLTNLHQFIYDLQINKSMYLTIPFGLDFVTDPSKVVVIYNASSNVEVEQPTDLQLYAHALFARTLWQLEFGSETNIFNENVINESKLENEFNLKNIKTEENSIKNNLNHQLNITENQNLLSNQENGQKIKQNNLNRKKVAESRQKVAESRQKVAENHQKIDVSGENLNENSENSKSVKDDKPDIVYGSIAMQRQFAMMRFGQVGPMLLVCGLITIIPLIVSQPVSDIRGEIRQYMVQCTLKIFPYWLASLLIDFCIWTGVTTIVWALFNAGMIESFHDNLFNSWYLLVFQGPSFILFLYCFSFLFSHPTAAPRQIFLLLALFLLIAVIISMILMDLNPVWLDRIYSLIPHIGLDQALSIVLSRMGSRKESLGFYWKYEHTMPYLIMQWGDIVIYGVLLYIIEANRNQLQRKAAKRSFGDYQNFFKKQKARNPQSSETKAMEDEVHASKNRSNGQGADYAVRIENVSRLFINAAGEPIPAVNDVSLGVKEGSLFGFLGANGAGKTTLIRMITGSLPPSEGTIEIFGIKTEDLKDTTVLSICPQFNNHLCMELTPREHFKLYSLLFQIEKEEGEELVQKLMKEMELIEFADKPIRELSGGDVRKLAIALSFFGPAKLILLDEPTASLDPVACRCVQEMILEHKGEKTFMLCTHILSEAEMLCDVISIMVKGNVYTVGSPAYLTQKFGKEYKIDIMLHDDSEETMRSVDQFFARELPQATLNIKRPVSRIYSIPASTITLPELFEIMQSGEEDPTNGFTYFTCSSSSLERVFMEIVHLSESAVDSPYGDESAYEEKYASDDSEATIKQQMEKNTIHNTFSRGKNMSDKEVVEITTSNSSLEDILSDKKDSSENGKKANNSSKKSENASSISSSTDTSS